MAKIYIVENVTNLDEEKYDLLLDRLLADRKNKTLNYKKYEDRCRSLVAGILLKYMFKNEYGMDIDGAKISLSEYGKPYLDIKGDSKHFNLSHSGGIVTGIIDEYENGIDVEKIAEYDSKIAKRFFCKEEYEYIEKSDNKNMDFFRMWTIKEAYMKYLALGMKKPLDSFSISFIDDEKSKIYDKELEKEILDYTYSYKLDEDYYISSVSKNKPIIKKLSVDDIS